MIYNILLWEIHHHIDGQVPLLKPSPLPHHSKILFLPLLATLQVNLDLPPLATGKVIKKCLKITENTRNLSRVKELTIPIAITPNLNTTIHQSISARIQLSIQHLNGDLWTTDINLTVTIVHKNVQLLRKRQKGTVNANARRTKNLNQQQWSNKSTIFTYNLHRQLSNNHLIVQLSQLRK